MAPDHEKLLRIGTEGIIREAEHFSKKPKKSGKIDFYEAVKIADQNPQHSQNSHAECADQMAQTEDNQQRKSELIEIEEICRQVPKSGAETFQEAAPVNDVRPYCAFQESMGETLCPGAG
ncbi:MAG: pyruvate formate lyase family protein [Desulfobacterales bacterium]